MGTDDAMNATLIQGDEKGALVRQAMTLPEKAATIKVESEESKLLANEFYLVCRDMRKKIGAFFDPHIERAKEAKRKADEARAALVQEKEKAEEPIKKAEYIIGRELQGYVEAQEEIARTRREAAEAEARKRAEEDALQAAVEAERLNMPELANRILAEPVQPVISEPLPAPPKVEGMAFVESWSGKVVDLRALAKAALEGRIPLDAIQANEVLIGQTVRALKKNFNWPGVQVSMEKKPRGTTGGRR